MKEKETEKEKEKKLTTTKGNIAILPSLVRVGGVAPHPGHAVWVSAFVMIAQTLPAVALR